MRTATMSILGLYNFNESIFDELQTPEGIVKNDLIVELLAELAGLEIVYPDWNTMKVLIGVWSRHRIENWERMFKAFYSEYNPIHNFDRTEEWRDSGKGKGTSRTENRNKVAGFNEKTLVDSGAGSSSGESESSSETAHEGHLYGNIGVTRTQDMINDEIRLRATDMHKIIINEFREKFCIQVY